MFTSVFRLLQLLQRSYAKARGRAFFVLRLTSVSIDLRRDLFAWLLVHLELELPNDKHLDGSGLGNSLLFDVFFCIFFSHSTVLYAAIFFQRQVTSFVD